MVDFDTQRALRKNRIRRRGIYILPNLFTIGRAVRGLLRDRAGDEPALRPGGDRDLRRDGAGRPRRPRRAAHPDAERVRRRIRQPGRHGELRRGARADRLRVGAERHGQARLDRGLRLRRRRGAAARALQHDARRRRQALVHRACRARPRRRWSPGCVWIVDDYDIDPARAQVVGVGGHGVRRPHDGEQRSSTTASSRST